MSTGVFNRSGLIALAIVAAIVAWRAFYDDGSEQAKQAKTRPAHTAHSPAPRPAEIRDGGFDGS